MVPSIASDTIVLAHNMTFKCDMVSLQTLHGDILHRVDRLERVDMERLPFALRHAALAECHDCYAAFLPSLESKLLLMRGFASLWCLTEQDAMHHLLLNKPSITVRTTRA